MGRKGSMTKDPNYYNNYYKNHKEKYNTSKKKSYAITQCGLSRDIADQFEESAMLVGRFQKLYLKLKDECPEALDFMIQYLAKKDETKEEV
jgi:hypothetical protein